MPFITRCKSSSMKGAVCEDLSDSLYTTPSFQASISLSTQEDCLRVSLDAGTRVL